MKEGEETEEIDDSSSQEEIYEPRIKVMQQKGI